jgi:glycine cleavage system aminomethyltransferase T
VRVETEGSEPFAAGAKLDEGEVTSSIYSPELGKVVSLVYTRAR